MAALGAPEPIGPGHDATGLACGVPALDAWLRREAHRAAATFVVHHGGRIAGFYTLAPGSVKERRTLPGMRSDGSLPVLKLGPAGG